MFYKYGKISRVSIKPGEAGGMPAFCFVEFSHPDEAYDAVKALDGREKLGKRLRVRRGEEVGRLRGGGRNTVWGGTRVGFLGPATLMRRMTQLRHSMGARNWASG